jgi:uncharacterized protein (DUF4415 family)/uncharacterized DUF497 family protein
MATRFEWDRTKAAINLRKHAVSFDIAVRVFADPFALTLLGESVGGELRWQTLGLVEGHLLLLVSHTTRDDEEGRQPRGDVMSKKLFKRTVDLATLPSLRKKQKAELAALSARPESEIDFSDIPELTENLWKNAVRGKYYKPTKTSTTVRIDSDVLAWLRAQGKGYQSRINAILRREMMESLK